MSKRVIVSVKIDETERSVELDSSSGFDLIEELPFNNTDRKALINTMCGVNLAFERR